jgi:non-ribosomal peptide synthetase component F
MSQDNRNRLKEMLASGEARLQPLTFSQRELWEASPVPAAESSNHICTFMEVRGTITDAECRTALQLVVDRQEVMRLSILPGKDQPLQFIRKTRAAAIEFSELSTAPGALEEKLQTIFEKPFDLLRGPLYRVEVIRRGPDDLVLAFAIHHAIADGWTLGVFVEDLCAAYLQGRMGVAGALPATPLSYTAWGAGERDFWNPEKLEQRGQFWIERLAGAPRLWEAVTDDAPRVLARDVSFLPASLTQAVRNLARRADATLFSTLLTAFQMALSQWTGATDIVVGTPVANRTKQSVRETMGYCSGNVPIRSEVRGDRPLEESVRETHLNAMDAFANAIPFAELVRAVGDPPSADHNPVFDVRFALQNHPIPDITVPGLSVQMHMRSTGTARFDLGCEITESGDELEVVWIYRPKIFSRADIENVGNLFLAVLQGIPATPEGRAAALAMT